MEAHSVPDGKVRLYKRPRSNAWQCSVYLEGKEWRASSRRESLAQASEFAEDWYLELRGKIRAGEVKAEKTFAQACELFTKEYAAITAGQHTDRGSQYCSHDYQLLLKTHGIIPSMSGKGNCYNNAMVETNNAMVESVFKTIKNELIWRTSFQTRAAAELALGRYIDGFYNPRRRQSAPGYKSPASFEANMAITE